MNQFVKASGVKIIGDTFIRNLYLCWYDRLDFKERFLLSIPKDNRITKYSTNKVLENILQLKFSGEIV